MTAITFVTPVGMYHRDHVSICASSVREQTIECEHIVVYDTESRGAGYARNKGLSRVTTPFVAFIDADDWLEPRFAERMLQHWRGDRYLYCDYFRDSEVIFAPDCLNFNQRWHGITCLIPTVWALEIGMFNPHLSGGEDTDFSVRLCAAGHCGRRVPEPLFHYGSGGQRAQHFVASVEYPKLLNRLTENYKDRLYGVLW